MLKNGYLPAKTSCRHRDAIEIVASEGMTWQINLHLLLQPEMLCNTDTRYVISAWCLHVNAV